MSGALETTTRGKNWGDDHHDTTATTATTDENVDTVVEFAMNDKGERVKITRKIQRQLQTHKANKSMAERKRWKKFGAASRHGAGPEKSTTTVGENIVLKMTSNIDELDTADDVASGDKVASKLKDKKISCRLCKGEHWTTQCPYKDNIAALEAIGLGTCTEAPKEEKKDDGKPAKYVPPSMRAGASSTATEGESMNKRDEGYAIRITNLSEETNEDDLTALARPFGRPLRSYLSRDRNTGVCRGFAFVNYAYREEAEAAIKSLNGYGYDNLILHVEWAQKQEAK